MSASHGKHILIIVENLPVPFDRRVWQEALTLRDGGYRVSVICPALKPDFAEPRATIEGIEIYRHPLPTEGNGLLGFLREFTAALRFERRLARQIFERDPFDAVQACSPPDLLYIVARPFKRRHRIPFVFDHHDVSPELYEAKYGKKGIIHRLLLHFERKTFELADRSIAPNDSYRSVAIGRGGMDPERVSVVRNGPDLSRIYPVPPDETLKRGRRFLVSYLGVIGKQEGLSYLVEAARHLVHDYRRTDIHFAILGSGPELPSIENTARDLEVDQFFDFYGRVPDDTLRTVLSTADVCVNPDEANEMNDISTMNKIMEYMAFGKPVVQFDLREGRVSAAEASLYAEPNNAGDLADKILWLIEHPTEAHQIGESGRRRIETALQWEHQSPTYLALYDELLAVEALSPPVSRTQRS
jgi:glycosyltransferase involved in cell wall biosynthesis